MPVVAAEASPVDGCFDTGVMSAARASSGVGILAKSADCDGACSVIPGLICPVFGTKPGLVGIVALSSAWIVRIDDTARTQQELSQARGNTCFSWKASIGCTQQRRKGLRGCTIPAAMKRLVPASTNRHRVRSGRDQTLVAVIRSRSVGGGDLGLGGLARQRIIGAFVKLPDAVAVETLLFHLKVCAQQ